MQELITQIFSRSKNKYKINSTKTFKLGYYDLNPFSKCTIGLWGGDGNSRSSSSESGSTNTDKKASILIEGLTF